MQHSSMRKITISLPSDLVDLAIDRSLTKLTQAEARLLARS